MTHKTIATVLALSAIERIGRCSPAGVFASDTHLLKWFTESFLVCHDLVDAICDARGADEVCKAIDAAREECNNEEHKEQFRRAISAHIIEAVVDAISANLSSAAVVTAGLLFLTSVTFMHMGEDARSRERIGECGGLAVIVAAMFAHQKNSDVQDTSCATVWNAVFSCPSNRAQFTEAKGIVAIINALRNFSSIRLYERACGALTNVLDNNELGQLDLAEHGGIDVLVQKMRDHPSSVSVQMTACAALWNLAFSTGKQIAERGGIAAVVSAFKCHNSADVLDKASGALFNLLATESLYSKYMTPEIEETVRSAVQRNPTQRLIRHCLDAITRKENPAVKKSREVGCCSRVYAPRCTSGNCGAPKQLYCQSCYVVGLMYSCQTCESTMSKRICESCYRLHHAGHRVVALFVSGSCDCELDECKKV